MHWKDWCWSWNSKTLATWCEELTHLKRPWCWERLKAGGEGDNRGWDGWMASPTRRTWVWVDSGSWWWTGRPAVLQSMGSQRVRHDWATELNWISVLNGEFGSCIYSVALTKGCTVPAHMKTPRNAVILLLLWDVNLQSSDLTHVHPWYLPVTDSGRPLFGFWQHKLAVSFPSSSLTYHDVGGIDVVCTFSTQGWNANPGSFHWEHRTFIRNK